ncbi:ribonuclease HI family protein [bacterium]|nr:ribonuclease HI family protein [bacterium]
MSKHTLPENDNSAEAWIDGASSGNPGPAGAGAVIKVSGRKAGEWQLALGETTNNIAEYQGLLLALRKALEMGIHSLVVYTDSELLFRQMKGIYKVRNPGIAKLYLEVKDLERSFKILRIEHVPRELNKEADRLARKARGG